MKQSVLCAAMLASLSLTACDRPADPPPAPIVNVTTPAAAPAPVTTVAQAPAVVEVPAPRASGEERREEERRVEQKVERRVEEKEANRPVEHNTVVVVPTEKRRD